MLVFWSSGTYEPCVLSGIEAIGSLARGCESCLRSRRWSGVSSTASAGATVHVAKRCLLKVWGVRGCMSWLPTDRTAIASCQASCLGLLPTSAYALVNLSLTCCRVDFVISKNGRPRVCFSELPSRGSCVGRASSFRARGLQGFCVSKRQLRPSCQAGPTTSRGGHCEVRVRVPGRIRRPPRPASSLSEILCIPSDHPSRRRVDRSDPRLSSRLHLSHLHRDPFTLSNLDRTGPNGLSVSGSSSPTAS